MGARIDLNEEVKSRDAFTLIELLAVIAVIAVLAAILVPTLGGVRANSNRAEGASNLRQLGAAFQLYAAENNGKIPYQQSSPTETWHLVIAPFINDFENSDWANLAINERRPPGVFACPASDSIVRFGNYSDFGMNPQVGDHFSNSRQKTNFVIPDPARTILLGDSRNCARFLSPWVTNYNLEARHPGETVNLLYLDGHVANVTLESVTTDLTGDIRFQPPWGWPQWSTN